MIPHDLIIIHPAWQVAFTLLGLYVAWLGIKRLGSSHLGRKASFPGAGTSCWASWPWWDSSWEPPGES